MQLLLNFLAFNVWLSKEEKEKNEGKGATIPLNSLEITSARGGGACNNEGKGTGGLFSLHLCDQKQQLGYQSTSAQYLENWVLF